MASIESIFTIPFTHHSVENDQFSPDIFWKKTTVDLKKHAARSSHKFHEMLLIEETLHHWDV